VLVIYGEENNSVLIEKLSLEDIAFISEKYFLENDLIILSDFLDKIIRILSFREINALVQIVYNNQNSCKEFLEEMLLTDPLSSIIELKLQRIDI
jgi:hypothetical protein